MSAPPSGGGTPIENRRQLIEYFAAGNKPRAAWRLGTEHEKFGFDKKTLKPLPYDGRARRARHARRADALRLGAGDRRTTTHRAAARQGQHHARAGRPVRAVGRAARDGARDGGRDSQHLREVKEVANEIGAGYIGLGFAPEWKREDIHWMPKGRYKIMREYMPKKGKLGLDMMLRTCTVQTNLDFESEADMVKKFRVSLALQPLATALFANSPFVEGKAVRLQELSQPHLDRHRSRPLRHAALRVRGRLRLRALCRLHARRADVLRLSRRQVRRCLGPGLPAISSRASCRRGRASCRRSTTGPITSPRRSPRCG